MPGCIRRDDLVREARAWWDPQGCRPQTPKPRSPGDPEVSTALELTPALPVVGAYLSIVLLHTALQERYRKRNRPVGVDDGDERLPHLWERPPSADIVIPTYNEDPAVLEACLDSLARQDYKGEMRFLVVDDGSSNLGALLPVYRKYGQRPDWSVLLTNAGNLGKRHAQQSAIYGAAPTTVTLLDTGNAGTWGASQAEFILMVDSDTVVEPDGVSWILTPFIDEDVAAVTGDVGILNHDANRLTRLIQERYRLLFGHERAAQSHFGKVFCCAGPFSAYRRQNLDEAWDDYMGRMFWRSPCTFGDDLQLTNLMLERCRKSIYQPRAKSFTTAPTTLRAYIRQQWRWNRSFYRQFRWILPVICRNRNAYQVFDLVARTLPPLLLIMASAKTLYDLVTLEPGRLPADLMAVGAMMLVGFAAVLWQTRRPRFALLYGFVYVALLLPTRIWALCTLGDSRWGTRTLANTPAWRRILRPPRCDRLSGESVST
jgi:hyaluronan synthase